MPWLPQGERNLTYWVKMLSMPTVAIGGIDLSNLSSLKKTGVEVISLINAISAHSLPQQAFLSIRKRWEE